jgi:putative transposase
MRSTYHRHPQRQADPARRSARAHRDDTLRLAIQRVYDEHHQVYGLRKVWKQLRREGIRARCTVERLIRAMGLAGAVRGRAWVTTTQARDGGRPADLVERQFVATRPNQRWVSDFAYVATRAASSTSRSSSTCSHDGPWAGACRRRCAPTSCSTRWSRPFARDVATP